MLQLTHNDRNGVGDAFREKTDAGLSRLERLAHALGMRGYSDDAIEKIVGGNIARVLGSVLGS